MAGADRSPVLAVEGLVKRFGGVVAVDGVSFSVGARECLALIGPNGAGKSTLFNMVNGQLAPDAGAVRFAGRDVTGMPPRAIWRLGIGRTFQIAATFRSMTVIENVQVALASHDRALFSFFRPLGRRRRADALALLAQVGLAGLADRSANELAYGDLKRLEIAIALANEPRLLLMDEPTAGMSPGERGDLVELVRRLVAERGISVLFTEHSMDFVFAFADRVVVLSRGALIAEGPVEAIRADPQVQEVYLGSGFEGLAERVRARADALHAGAGA